MARPSTSTTRFRHFDKKEVRQAMAYAIDRHENGTVSLGESGRPPKYMAGFFDDIRRQLAGRGDTVASSTSMSLRSAPRPKRF